MDARRARAQVVREIVEAAGVAVVRAMHTIYSMERSGPRILVADDDPDVLRDVAEALESMGARITRAASGAELMAHLGDDDPYDLIVTDVAMPWMTGIQAMHSTRYAGLATPVLVITALRDESLPATVQALGHNAMLLRKPFGMSELAAAVARLIPHALDSRERA
jgi:two-component system OmpR family response regulator